MHPEDRPATLAVMDQLAAGATKISFENRYHCKDGSWKWLRWTASPLQGRQEIYASARDVTRRKQLELQILAASEHEQQRISRDLHDSLGPHLAAICYAATFLADELRQRNHPAAAKADQIGAMASEAVAIARDLARGIFPVQPDGLGLALALEELADTTSRQTDMAVSFAKTGDTRPTDPADDLHLFRIAQEALSNAAKHSAARHVTIVLHHSNHALRLTLADDGQGLPPSPHDARAAWAWTPCATGRAPSAESSPSTPSPAKAPSSPAKSPSARYRKFSHHRKFKPRMDANGHGFFNQIQKSPASLAG